MAGRDPRGWSRPKMSPANPARIKAQEVEIQARVKDKYWASDTVVALEMSAVDGGPLPRWDPGAHVDFMLPNGLIRQYSLCGNPEDNSHWRFGVLREENSRGGSAYIHSELKRHDVLRLNGPRNTFPLVPAGRYCFIAGGIGITPILPMVRAAHSIGSQWKLIYGGRTRASMAFTSELSALGNRVILRPQDDYGLLDLDEVVRDLEPNDAVYCCGPESLIRAVEARFNTRPDYTLRVERFTNSDVSPHGTSFSVRLCRSGKTIEVGADESILEAMENVGLRPAFSCREGVCGTCETVVLAGRPDHRDDVLSETERAHGRTMMICVSRSFDPLLELDV
jgi:ferredoxin-NADP reductase